MFLPVTDAVALLFNELHLELHGADVAKGGVTTVPVVEDLDEIEDRLSCLSPGREATRVDALGFEGGEEALGDGCPGGCPTTSCTNRPRLKVSEPDAKKGKRSFSRRRSRS
jgi:hypothetical protein